MVNHPYGSDRRVVVTSGGFLRRAVVRGLQAGGADMVSVPRLMASRPPDDGQNRPSARRRATPADHRNRARVAPRLLSAAGTG